MIHPLKLILLFFIHSSVGPIPNPFVPTPFPTLIYNATPTWLDDPEPRRTIAYNENRFGVTWERDGSGDLGNTFAGKTQFPWIVDIRPAKRLGEQGYWSTGNLINQFTIFTTCRAINDIGSINPPFDVAFVTFGQQYMFEYTHRDVYGSDWEYGGRRTVIEAKKHPKCNVRLIAYDGGLLTIKPSIHPLPPTINTMPITLNYFNGEMPNFDLTTMDQQEPGRHHGRVCYVASFGRDWNNIIDTIVKDYKVKYRVYWEEPEFCRVRRDKLCPNRWLYSTDCDIGGGYPEAEGKELMCFQSRQKVGTVCDHDKGAPLVCDGVVFGLVVLGAKPAY